MPNFEPLWVRLLGREVLSRPRGPETGLVLGQTGHVAQTRSLKVSKAQRLRGTIRPPSDKSLTHRAFILAAMATQGPSRIVNPLVGEDCLSTVDCLRETGADIEIFDEDDFGTSPFALVTREREWSSPDVPLDCGNSGTTIRLLAGLLASKPGLDAVLVGDASLSRRPMRRIVSPLLEMGASIEGETPPLRVSGRQLTGINYMSPVASAQVKTCLLLAGLGSLGETWVSEPSLSRDHTERMFESLGIDLMRDERLGVGVRGGQTPDPLDFEVPGDISSAAFLMVAAAMVPGSDLTLMEVGVNPTRTGVIDVLKSAGVQVLLEHERESTGEPVADVRVSGSAELAPFSVSGELVPRLVDEIPVLAVLASQCDGVSSFRDASELKVKESDRIETVATGLRAMGCKVETFEDGMSVFGPTKLVGATIDATGDHRIAMAFAVAGLLADGETTILNAESVATSYPNFEADLRLLVD